MQLGVVLAPRDNSKLLTREIGFVADIMQQTSQVLAGYVAVDQWGCFV